MRIAILGAGITGISLGRMLADKKIDVDIYEKENHVGGLCRTEIIDGYVFDKSGGHVFNSKNPEILKWVFNILPKDNWIFSKRKSKILYKDKLLDYPFELSLSKLDVDDAIECIVDLFKRNKNNPKNFREWILNNFGFAISNRYMIPYNEKIWKFPLNKMDIDWMSGKMPFPDERKILSALLTRNSNENMMPHSTYYYPINGGIQTLIDAIAENILKNIHLNTKVESIEKINKKLYINGCGPYDRVISTLPLKNLSGIMKLSNKIKDVIDSLKYNSVMTILYPIPKSDKDYSWIYLPNKEIIPHRMMHQGILSPNNCPPGMDSITVEISKPELYKAGHIFKNVKKELKISTEPIAINNTKFAYVIFDEDRAKNIILIKEYMSQLGINLLGRFGEWEYPNMDICIERAMEEVDNII